MILIICVCLLILLCVVGFCFSNKIRSEHLKKQYRLADVKKRTVCGVKQFGECKLDPVVRPMCCVALMDEGKPSAAVEMLSAADLCLLPVGRHETAQNHER